MQYKRMMDSHNQYSFEVKQYLVRAKPKLGTLAPITTNNSKCNSKCPPAAGDNYLMGGRRRG